MQNQSLNSVCRIQHESWEPEPLRQCPVDQVFFQQVSLQPAIVSRMQGAFAISKMVSNSRAAMAGLWNFGLIIGLGSNET